MTRLLLLLSLVLGVALWTTSASAQGQGHGHGHAKPDNNTDAGSNGHSNSGASKTHDNHDDAEEEGSHHGPPSRPPGWDKGEKKGWNGGSVPPGLAKHGEGNEQSLGDIARQYRREKADRDAANNASGTSETHASTAGSGSGHTRVNSGHRPPIQHDSQSKTVTPADKKQK